MGLKTPRGKFERLDTLLPAKIWRTLDRADPPVAATCRNVGARGCRLSIEDAKLAPGLDVEDEIPFALTLSRVEKELSGVGRIVWLKKERGEAGKTRVLLGVEFTSVSLQDRERIKSFIAAQLGSPYLTRSPGLST